MFEEEFHFIIFSDMLFLLSYSNYYIIVIKKIIIIVIDDAKTRYEFAVLGELIIMVLFIIINHLLDP
jgi:hypothetical protein